MVFPFSKWGNRVFWGIVFAALAFLILGFGLRFYYDWHDRKQIEQMAKNLDQFEKDRQAAMAADTIGGQTPQETLQMFIDAVEAGDYDLASKYFVIEKQDEELKSLQNSPKENIDNVIGLLKKTTLVDSRKSLEESYDTYGPGHGSNQSKEEFVETMLKIYKGKETMRTKLDGYNFDVSFVLYPLGNWKIEEI